MILIDIALYKGKTYFVVFREGSIWRYRVEVSKEEFVEWVRRVPCEVDGELKFVRKLTNEEVEELLDVYGDDYTAYLKGRYIYLQHEVLKRTFRIKWDYSINAYRLYQILRERKYVKLKALARVVMGEYLSGLIFKVVEAVEVIP